MCCPSRCESCREAKEELGEPWETGLGEARSGTLGVLRAPSQNLERDEEGTQVPLTVSVLDFLLEMWKVIALSPMKM